MCDRMLGISGVRWGFNEVYQHFCVSYEFVNMVLLMCCRRCILCCCVT